MSREHEPQPPHQPDGGAHAAGPDSESGQPFELPPVLAEFLKDQRYACVTEATDQGTAFVVKAPRRDIEGLRGNVPIEQRHELYRHPSAPVIRLLTTLYDQPERPLKLETFINVGDDQQRAELAALAEQEDVLMLFYDEALQHQLNKRVRTIDGAAITAMLAEAGTLRAAIPAERFDFYRAKAEVMEVTQL
jgi:hypothetical protein